jgi:hypothetical protein
MFLLSTSEPHYLDYTLSAMQSPYTRSYRLSTLRYRQPSPVYPFWAIYHEVKLNLGPEIRAYVLYYSGIWNHRPRLYCDILSYMPTHVYINSLAKASRDLVFSYHVLNQKP